MSGKKKHEIHFTSVLVGVLASTVVFLSLQNMGLRDRLAESDKSDKTDNSAKEENTETDSVIKEYLTDLKKFTITTEDGVKVTYHTPKDWYSLTDQYQENIQTFYSDNELEVNNMFVVGDSDTTGKATGLINAAPVSEVSRIMKQVYGDEYKEEDMLVSEAYTYMTTGKLPDDLPDNYEIEELDVLAVSGVNYKVYEINYDTTYTDTEPSSEAVEDSTEAMDNNSTVVHTQKIACYSDTEDPIEIILYLSEFDRDNALSLLREFLGI